MVTEHRPLRQQAAALVVIGKCHAPEAAAVDAGDSVVAREPFVDESVIGVQQIVHAAILANRAADEHFRFRLERRSRLSS